MKKIKKVLIAIIIISCIPLLILLMFRISFIISENKIHREIVSFVEENIEDLKKISTNKNLTNYEKEYKLDKFEIIKDKNFNDILNFNYSSKGFSFSSSYYGFFYIPNNNINLYFDKEFIQKDNKFNYKEEESDNTIYLEKIKDEFYYYKINY